jgi:tetratricopeptide (TPR) repeat protein
MLRCLIGVESILLVSAVLLPGQGSDKQQQIEEHTRRMQQDLQDKRPDLAITELKALLAIDPSNVEARGNLGVLEFFSDRYTDAAQDLHTTLSAKPDLWKIQALLGMSEKRLGETAKAQADLAKAFPQLDERKLKIETGLELIEADYGLNDLGNAADVVNVLRQLEPANPDILYAAYRIYSELTNESILSLTMVAPDSARMHQVMAHELARQAKDDAAIANYREALKLNPKSADIHYELAEMLFTQSSSSAQNEAEQQYKAALASNPFDEKSVCRLGDIAVRRSDFKTAREFYSRALNMQPDDADANFGMAKILMASHEPQKAVAYLERAAQIEPYNASTHYRLGSAYREIGRAEDSRRELAEFEKLKKMKARLGDLYQEMRLSPGKNVDSESDQK